MLWNDATPDQTLDRLRSWGVKETALKQGADGARVVTTDATVHVACPQQVTAIDTTAAGDSFNAAYLAARLKGQSPSDAALAGHRLAAAVIQHRGAIVPKHATAMLQP